MADDIMERVKRVMAKCLKIPPELINDDTSSDNIAGWDSVSHVKLMFEIEDEFGVEFSVEEVEELLSFSEIVEKIRQIAGETKTA